MSKTAKFRRYCKEYRCSAKFPGRGVMKFSIISDENYLLFLFQWLKGYIWPKRLKCLSLHCLFLHFFPKFYTFLHEGLQHIETYFTSSVFFCSLVGPQSTISCQSTQRQSGTKWGTSFSHRHTYTRGSNTYGHNFALTFADLANVLSEIRAIFWMWFELNLDELQWSRWMTRRVTL